MSPLHARRALCLLRGLARSTPGRLHTALAAPSHEGILGVLGLQRGRPERSPGTRMLRGTVLLSENLPWDPQRCRHRGTPAGFLKKAPKCSGLSCIPPKDTFKTQPPEPEGEPPLGSVSGDVIKLKSLNEMTLHLGYP